jgi:glycerate dehydrogenase
VGVTATGHDIVDTETARALGITVTNIPTYGTTAVSQFAFALLLELCHQVCRHSGAVREGEWSRAPDWSFRLSPQVELAGKTMGIVGLGRIGRQTARIADAFGMRVIAHDAMPGPPLEYPGFRYVAIEELLGESDAVSLHCPLTPENNGLINAARLKLMKPGAFLLNTSRGPLVVDQDLAAALHAGTIAGAGLDVLSVEPPLDDNPLLGAPNCVITPHMAWASTAARTRLLDQAVANLAAFLDGRPMNVVGG